MRLILAGALSCAFFGAQAPGASAAPTVGIEGEWEGMIEIPRRPVLLRVHLSHQEGGWEGTAQVPGAGSVPLTEVWVDPPRVGFVLPLEDGVRFDGRIEEGVLSGHARQGESVVSFRLEKEPVLPRPADRAEAWLQDLGIAERKLLAYDRSFADDARDEARRRLRLLQDEGLVYVHFSRTRRAEGPELLDLVTAGVDQPPTTAGALVLDLRWNTGGDNTTAKSFLEWVAGSHFNAKGRLFVIMGRATFSAGLYSAAWLAQHTEAVFVGEPAGDVLDYWSEGGNIQLPHSGLTVHFANGFHGYSKRSYPEREPFFEDLSVESLEPDLPVSFSFADWRAGRDPALEAIAERRASNGSAIR